MVVVAWLDVCAARPSTLPAVGAHVSRQKDGLLPAVGVGVGVQVCRRLLGWWAR